MNSYSRSSSIHTLTRPRKKVRNDGGRETKRRKDGNEREEGAKGKMERKAALRQVSSRGRHRQEDVTKWWSRKLEIDFSILAANTALSCDVMISGFALVT